MCDAWNDKASRVEDEGSFVLPYAADAQNATVRFLSSYTYEGLDVILRQVQEDIRNDKFKANIRLFNNTWSRSQSAVRKLDAWNTQTGFLKRDEISGDEYWNVVALMEELIEAVDGSGEFSLVNLNTYAPSFQLRKRYNDILNSMTQAFIAYRDDVIKPLHTQIDNLRAMQHV